MAAPASLSRRLAIRLRALWHGTRARLFLLVLLTVIPATAVQFVGAWSNLQQNLADRTTEVTHAASHAQGDFDTLLTRARTVFTDLVRLNEMRTPNSCTLIFTSLRLSYERLAPEATNLGLSDASGNLYCAVNPVQGESNLAAQPYFQNAVKTLDMSVGAYARNPLTGAASFAVAYPVTSFEGQVQTVIVAVFDASWLTAWQNEASLPDGAAYTLLSLESEPLLRVVDGKAVELTAAAAPAAWLGPLQAGQSVMQAPDLDGVMRLHALAPLSLKGQTAAYLQVGYPVAPLYTKAYQSLEWELVLLALTAAAAMALAAVGSESLFLRPLRQLMGVTGQVEAGDLTARATGVRGLAELTRLARAFDRMTGALQQREADRRRALAELQESEARFRAIFESSPTGIGVMGLDGRVLDMNPAMCRMYGYAREELVGQTPTLVTYPEDATRSAELFEEVTTGKRNYYWDVRRYVRKNGEVFWAQATMSMVRDPEGQPLYLVGMVTDISEQRRALAQLQESEARFRAMYENAALGVVILDVDTLTIRANPAAQRLLDDPNLSVVLNDLHEFISPQYREAEWEQIDDLVHGRRDTYTTEHHYERPGEEVRWAHITLSAVREADGRLRHLVAMMEDITERRKAEATLQESEARFRAILDNAAVGVAVMTLDRRIVQANPTAVRLTGYAPDELQALDPSLLAVEADRYLDRDLFQELVTGKRNQYLVEKRYHRKDGGQFWGRVNFALVRDGAGKPLYTIGMIEDITEEKRAAERLAAQEAEYRQTLERRIAQRTEELNEANERLREKAAQDAVTAERTRLARDLHDAVTQTLFSATLIADVLPELWRMNPAEGLRRLEELHQLTRGALAEMRTLLVELRPNALVEVPLPTLLRQLAEALAGRARLSIQVSAEGQRRLPADVQIGLYRIAQEALNNVVKHAKATQAVVTLRLGEMVRLTVADNGAGFDPATVTADHLGLRIMHERADAIQARLTVYSEPGEGTQISVTWA
jgi:PAS domain S-box-containing protein